MYDHFRELSRGIADPMLLVERGIVRAANPAAEEHFGQRDLADVPLEALVTNPPENVAGALRIWSRTVTPAPGALTPRSSQPSAYTCEGWRVYPLESVPRVIVRMRPKLERVHSFIVLNEKIDALRAEILYRQTVEEKLRRSESALAERIEQVERANRMKDEFLATLSHELRTPINAIVNWVHLLHSADLDENTRRRALETITRNARQQAHLISDILDVSRIVAGKLRLNLRTADLTSVISDAVETVRPAADAKSIELHTVLDPAAGPILGDPERLQQVMWNLLFNAVKFTPKQGRVRIALVRINSHVEVSVEDNGPGIHTEFLPYVFERFRQADSSSRRPHGGLGLGLAIVRNLVELHGGTVRAANRDVGTGAVFTIALPRQSVAPRQAVDGMVSDGHPAAERDVWLEAAPRLDGVRVLVVEDEIDSREVVARVLEECGAEVVTAASAAEALRALDAQVPDVIVSDIEMPERDGYALLRDVRERPAAAGGEVPAVAVTAYASTEDRMRALMAGFQLHLPKPVQPAELVTVVASLAGRVRARL